MADVCELAHDRTIIACRKAKIVVNVHDRITDGVKYSAPAQRIFDRHYDKIINATNL